ncbi:hypothetical protein Glove_461g44 [Diversispora epigaea]|uniref:Uncharacterized protein n=1 Tax=Diversispora epigaea TaxID=1348612 RepID=A0A397GTR5_9GLOM|nr:hypothetical protein Glove_461g44 [Diversispora epigaea]
MATVSNISHNNVIIDDRLLLFGGNENTTELSYLDLSKSFDYTNLTWNSIYKGDLPVPSNRIYTYNYLANEWDKPKILGNFVPIRQSIERVINNLGIIYLFGRYNVTSALSPGKFITSLMTFTILQTSSKLIRMKNMIQKIMNGHKWCVYFDHQMDKLSYLGVQLVMVIVILLNLATLDKNKYPFKWSIPKQAYVIITSGAIPNGGRRYYLQLKIVSLRHKNNTWVTSFNTPRTVTSSISAGTSTSYSTLQALTL